MRYDRSLTTQILARDLGYSDRNLRHRRDVWYVIVLNGIRIRVL